MQPTPEQTPPPSEPRPPADTSWVETTKTTGGSRKLLVALAVIGALVLAGAAVAITLYATQPDRKPAAAKSPSAWDIEQAQRRAAEKANIDSETLPDPAPTTEGPELKAADVKLSLKTIDKQCFGSAGCNVSVQVQAKHAGGLGTFVTPDTWLVTYEIRGGSDGPTIGSFEISDGSYDMNTEDLSTASSGTKLTVKVVDVEKQGL